MRRAFPETVTLSQLAFASAVWACALSGCTPRKGPPPKPLVWTMVHPVETSWVPVTGTAWELHFAATVGSNGARDRPPTRSFPCIGLDVRDSGTGAPSVGGGVACDETASPARARVARHPGDADRRGPVEAHGRRGEAAAVSISNPAH